MMVSSRPSTSSRVQARRSEFCDISRPETATPPALVRHRLGGARHVGALADGDHAVGRQLLRRLAVHLVLGGAREGDVGLDGPDALAAGGELGLGVLLDVVGDAAALHGLEVDDVGELLAVDAVLRTAARHSEDAGDRGRG
eukprot:scaffold4776_cov38-Phaeocystis_antarctica.AAC.1